MITKTKAAIIIPIRLGSSRLPNKPLALINNKEMMLHVGRKAIEANVGDVFFACAEQKLVDIAVANHYSAILTDSALPSGSDRVYAALTQLDCKYDYIVNLQGDMPTADPKLIVKLVELIQKTDADIVTAVAPIKNEAENIDPSVVKAVIGENGRALYFTRAPFVPYGADVFYHHIGIYVYKYDALRKFISLPQSSLERYEKLEQLRALENGMAIYALITDNAPKGVDTQQDLDNIRSSL